MSVSIERESISLLGLYIAFLVAISGLPLMLQCPKVQMNLISLLDLEIKLLILKASGSVSTFKLDKTLILSELEHISNFVWLILSAKVLIQFL